MRVWLRHWLADPTRTFRSAANHRSHSVERERQRLQAILDAAGEGIVFTNYEMVIEYVNPALEQLTGYTSAEIIGQTPSLWESGLTSPASLEEMRRRLAAAQSWRGEAIFRRKNGTLYDVALVISPLKDECGATIGFVRVQRDITHQKELDRLKAQWVSRIGHELRTPLANLVIYLALLQEGDPEKHDQYLLVLKQEADRMRRLVEDFMRVAELTAGQLPLEWESTDLNQLVSKVLYGLRERVNQRQLRVRFEPGHHLPHVILDASLISDVINRLLDNALNYTPGGGSITVATDVDPYSHPAHVLVCVKDTGPGIPPNELPSLFESFHRGEAASNFTTPGAGFGLAICQHIVALHHGRIEVQSEVNQGSTFQVWLPIKPRSEA